MPAIIKLAVFVLSATLSTVSLSQESMSEFKSDLVPGLKYPNTGDEGSEPILSFATPLRPSRTLGGFNQLLPYVLASPDQQDAGSCLYMSLTGAVEWWLAKLNPQISRAPDGPIDLSERFLMNLASKPAAQNQIQEWKTDTILALNDQQRALRNVDYRFTKGWHRTTAMGASVPSQPGQFGAVYDTGYNWIDGLKHAMGLPTVRLPKFSRYVLFADPESNQWNVGVAPRDIVAQVKAALTKNGAPVHVVYNHMGYWHAVLILGFNDSADSRGCPFMGKFFTRMGDQIVQLKKDESAATTEAERLRIRERIAKLQKAVDEAQTSYSANGGCSPKGVFYVRDSIYSDDTMPMYDYDPSRTGEEARYALPLIEHEYAWLTTLSNHVIQIFAQN